MRFKARLNVSPPLARVLVLILMAGGLLYQTACAEKSDGTGKAGTPGAGAAAQPATAKPAGVPWPEAPTYDLFNGKVEDANARFFQSPDFQKLLVLPEAGDKAFILFLKQRTWSAVPKTTVAPSADEALVAADLQPKSSGGLTQTGADLSFASGTDQFRVSPEAPIIGQTTRDQLLKKKGDYAAHVRAYQPKSAAVALLRSETQPVEITVFFGTWCSYCKKWLPQFIKALDVAANPNITVQYFGVDEGMSQPEGPLTQYGVSRTPTFIITVNGKELGRILEEPKKSMEEDLALILNGAQ